MYHLYRYVPQCSRCGSWKTGYFIKGNITDKWIIKWALKRGELVLLDSEPKYNCFCGNCGIEWIQDIPLKLLSEEDWIEQKELREIDTAFANAMDLFENDKKNIEKQRREKKWYIKAYRKITNTSKDRKQ